MPTRPQPQDVALPFPEPAPEPPPSRADSAYDAAAGALRMIDTVSRSLSPAATDQLIYWGEQLERRMLDLYRALEAGDPEPDWDRHPTATDFYAARRSHYATVVRATSGGERTGSGPASTPVRRRSPGARAGHGRASVVRPRASRRA